MNKKVKIILVDDEELFRKGIIFLLENEPHLEIIFEASNGQELIHFLKTKEIKPDIILMDLNMPTLNGIEATKTIHKNLPEIKIIALTSYNSKTFIANMIHYGAASYLVKNSTPAEMIQTINEVSANGFYYNQLVMEVIQEKIAISSSKTATAFEAVYLTLREKEILLLICNQLSTQEIAHKLFISTRTVDGHRNNLLIKTESKNVAGLVVYAIQKEIVKRTDIELKKPF